jgi:hypothetical protein
MTRVVGPLEQDLTAPNNVAETRPLLSAVTQGSPPFTLFLPTSYQTEPWDSFPFTPLSWSLKVFLGTKTGLTLI